MMMTDQTTESPQPAPPMGVSSSEGLGLAPERAAFEAWATKEGYSTAKVPGATGDDGQKVYGDSSTHAAWWAWQFALAAERERCAKIVDVPPGTEAWEVIGGEEGLTMLRELAAQIRGA